jgi:pyridoxamine 5'-phosphate oxidase family protein
MSSFTPAEIEYLHGHALGRLATIGADGMPHVVPARYTYNPEFDTIDVTGKFMGRSKKYRDAGRSARAAFVVDDMAGPGLPRGLEVRGRAEIQAEGGDTIVEGADPEFIRIVPTRIVSWGIDGHAYHSHGRDVPPSASR